MLLMLTTRALIWFSETDGQIEEYNPDDVTPGWLGFGFTVLFAAAVIVIGIDMSRRIRRVKYREEIREELAHELRQQVGGVDSRAAANPDVANPDVATPDVSNLDEANRQAPDGDTPGANATDGEPR